MEHTFSLPDYCVFSITVAVSISIGLYYGFVGKKHTTISEYLMGNRRMKVIPVAISLFVSFESSIMMLGFPAETYVYGTMIWVGVFGGLFAQCITVRTIVPLLYPLKLTSVYEYLEYRYQTRSVRLLGVCLGIFGNLLYTGVVLFGPGIALEAVTDFPSWVSITVVAISAVIYTTLGGIKAVVWTDVFQTAVMFLGIFAILIKGTVDAGGLKSVWDINMNNGRLKLFEFNPDPTVRHTFWCVLLGTTLRQLTLTVNQSSVQRMCATKSLRDAKTVMLLVAPAYFIAVTLVCIQGLVVYAYYYTKGCDPLASKQIKNPNQIVPYMVMDVFISLPGMPGLYMASLFSASLSTVSSAFSSLSAVTWEDLIQPCMNVVTDRKATLIARLLVVFYGAVAIGIAFIIETVGGTLPQITAALTGTLQGPIIAIFLMSAFIPIANSKGIILGSLIGAGFAFWVSMGQTFSPTLTKTPWLPLGSTDQCTFLNHSTNLTRTHLTLNSSTAGFQMISKKDNNIQGLDRLYSVSYQWFVALGFVATVLVGTCVSYVTGTTEGF